MDCQNLWYHALIFQKTVLIFTKSFLNFRSDTIEKQGTSDLRSYFSIVLAYVVLQDCGVTYLWEEQNPAFGPVP